MSKTKAPRVDDIQIAIWELESVLAFGRVSHEDHEPAVIEGFIHTCHTLAARLHWMFLEVNPRNNVPAS